MLSSPKLPMMHESNKERQEVDWMRKQVSSWRYLLLQGAALATLLLAAGARWKS